MEANYIDQQRSKKGFHPVHTLLTTIGQQNSILDGHSVLISEAASIGYDNVFYPGVVIEQQGEGAVRIGNGNTFYPGTYIYASHGNIAIGDHNEFGPAGVTVKANMPDVFIEVGSEGRYCDGANIMGKTNLGSGSQVLGAITVQGCVLASGGSSKEPNPDKRGAVLKGFGLARGISLKTGHVINGAGNFADAQVESQRSYHPNAPK